MKFVLLFLLSVSAVFASVSRNEVVAAVIIHEAGGEGERGMQAVAGVISNRMRPNRDAFAVVTRPHQFECITGKSHDAFVAKAKLHPRWAYALKLSEEIGNRKLRDITGGATHFHNNRYYVWWAKSPKMKYVKTIGNHEFYKER